jgi:orotidine 5'-phosphate decarboxylase subfamily 2
VISLGDLFLRKYYELSREKGSFLCIGLDPAISSMRDRFVVPGYLVERYGVREGIKRFCLEIVKAVAPYTPMIKLNAWYVLPPFSFDELSEIVEAIRNCRCLALLDAKLTDIGSTNVAGLYWIDEMGFDAVTFSPFPGYGDGTDVIYNWAAEEGKGVFVLCKMSNPGAQDYQSREVGGEPLYRLVAREALERGADGFVVGCTRERELGEVRGIIGEDKVIFAPGLGPQGGDPETAFRLGANKKGEALIISASRSINYAYEALNWPKERFAEAAAEEARREREQLNGIKKSALGKRGA